MPHGGMDRANYALAARLACGGREVHLVTHRAAAHLRAGGAVVHPVWRPAGAHALGMPLLARQAKRWAGRLADRRPIILANGGNCVLPALNWVHYVHAAYDPTREGTSSARAVTGIQRRYVLARERDALSAAEVIICNSLRTRADVVERLGARAERARVIYYGTDPTVFSPPGPGVRAAARAALGVHDERDVVLFVGALGDRRKGFDALFAAWTSWCRTHDAGELFVAGEGRELRKWRRRAIAEGVGRRVHFLGFRTDVSSLLAAADLLVHPARYEAYGLAVHEALCMGVPAIVSANAGVAERYPDSLRGLLLSAISAGSVLGALQRWSEGRLEFAAAVVKAGAALRKRTWNDMADEIVALGTAT